MPVARRFVVAQVNNALSPMFKGEIHIERVDGIGLHGATGIRGRITGPDGVDVIVADGVRARISFVSLVKSVLGKVQLILEAFTAEDDARLEALQATACRIASRGWR